MRFKDIIFELSTASGQPVGGDPTDKALAQGAKDPNKTGGGASFEDIFNSGIADDPTGEGGDDPMIDQSEDNMDNALDAGIESDMGDPDEAEGVLEKVSKHPFLARKAQKPEDEPLTICGKPISELNQLKAQANATIMSRERQKQFGTYEDEELQYLRDKVSFITAVLNAKKPDESSEEDPQ